MRCMLVALDVDGVLLDSQKVFHEVAQSAFGRRLPPPDEWSVWGLQPCMGLTDAEYAYLEAKIDRSKVSSDIPVYPGAQEFVTRLRKKHTVYFLTAQWRGVESWVEGRTEDLKNKFGDDIEVVFTHAKHLCRFDLLLDDKVANVLGVGSRGVLMERGWNSVERAAHPTMFKVKTFEEFEQQHAGAAWRNR